MAVDPCRIKDGVAQADLLGLVEHAVVFPLNERGAHGFDDLGVHDGAGRAQDAPQTRSVAEGRVFVDVAKHLQDDGAQDGVTGYGGNAPLDVFATRKGAQLGVDADAFVLLSRAVVPMRQDELVFRAQDVLEGLVQGGLDVNVHAPQLVDEEVAEEVGTGGTIDRCDALVIAPDDFAVMLEDEGLDVFVVEEVIFVFGVQALDVLDVLLDLVGQPGLRPIGLEDVSADLLAQCLLWH